MTTTLHKTGLCNTTLYNTVSANNLLRCVFVLLFALLAHVSEVRADDYSTRTAEDLPSQPSFTLQPGRMYVVRSNMILTASAAQSALVVAPKGSGQAPILYIPDGVTLTVTGGDAVGMKDESMLAYDYSLNGAIAKVNAPVASGEADGIVAPSCPVPAPAEVYSLSGTRMSGSAVLPEGLYVRGGKVFRAAPSCR